MKRAKDRQRTRYVLINSALRAMSAAIARGDWAAGLGFSFTAADRGAWWPRKK